MQGFGEIRAFAEEPNLADICIFISNNARFRGITDINGFFFAIRLNWPRFLIYHKNSQISLFALKVCRL